MDIRQINNEANPQSCKIIEHPITPYKLWLEFEETEPWENITNDFANIGVNTLDGRYYGINVWTKLFAKNNPLNNEKGNQIPDLIVDELSRKCIQEEINNILSEEPIESALNKSTFNLEFIAPYWSADKMKKSTIDNLMDELRLELNKSNLLYNVEYELIARKINNDDIVLKLQDDKIAVVHLTWKSNKETKGNPITRIYKDEIDFWTREMSKDITEYNS